MGIKTRALALLVLAVWLAVACEQTVAQTSSVGGFNATDITRSFPTQTNRIQQRFSPMQIEREHRLAQQQLTVAQQQWRMGAIRNLGPERAEFVERVYRSASSRPALVQSIGSPDTMLPTTPRIRTSTSQPVPRDEMYVYDRYGLVVVFDERTGRSKEIRFSEGNIPPLPMDHRSFLRRPVP